MFRLSQPLSHPTLDRKRSNLSSTSPPTIKRCRVTSLISDEANEKHRKDNFELNKERLSKDRLTSVPPEMLLQIISHIKTSDFLSMAQTCHGLRLFIKQKAPEICNTAVRCRFWQEAEVLECQLKDGWLVPTQKGFLKDEADFFDPDSKSGQFLAARRYNDYRLRPSDLIHKISTPGPGLLFFFERFGDTVAPCWGRGLDNVKRRYEGGSARGWLCDALEMMNLDLKSVGKEEEIAEPQTTEEVAKDKKSEWYRSMIWYLKKKMEWKDVYRCCDRARELMWFYGVSGVLRCREGDAWKKDREVEMCIEELCMKLGRLEL